MKVGMRREGTLWIIMLAVPALGAAAYYLFGLTTALLVTIVGIAAAIYIPRYRRLEKRAELCSRLEGLYSHAATVEVALREKQELLESIAKTSPTIFYTFDLAARRVLYCNRSIPESLGYSQAETEQFGPDPLPKVLHPEDLDRLFERLQDCEKLSDGQVYETELRCLDATCNLRWLQVRDVVFRRDEQGRPVQILSNIIDVTEKKNLDDHIEAQVLEIQDTNLALELQAHALEEANSQLEALAFTDGLTGIANHRSFQERLAKCCAECAEKREPISLMLIDVDHFKDYNDTYGHPCGDVILKRLAQILVDEAGSSCLASRYGGEEFAVLCPGYTAARALQLAEDIRRAVECSPWPERSVTISIGLATVVNGIGQPSTIVTQADTALYLSKAMGRNRVTAHNEAPSRMVI